MDVNDLKGLYAEAKKRMDGALERVRHDLANVRTGRASVGILENVHVEAYGAKVPLNQVAGLSIPEPSLIVAQPFDPSLMGAIEKAIRASDLGLNPSNDGKVVRIPIPPLTEERRKELSRHVHKLAEEGRNSLRMVRRDANERLKKLLKDHQVSEDDERRGLEEIQKITDGHIKLVDEQQKKKDQELLGTLTIRNSECGVRKATRNCEFEMLNSALRTPNSEFGSVSERDSHRSRGAHDVDVRRDLAGLADDVDERHGADVGRLKRDHLVGVAGEEQFDSLAAKPCREHAIEARRRTAALQVAEHDGSCLLPRQQFERLRNTMARATETLGTSDRTFLDERHVAVLRPRAFRDHDDAEVGAELVALLDRFRHDVDVVRNLGHEDGVCTAAETRVQRDPAGVAAHHLDHHHAAMRFGRRVQAVERIRGERDGRIEAEAVRRADDVVVDGLGDPNDGDAQLDEAVRQAEGAVAAYHDQAAESHLVEHLDHAVRVALLRAVRADHFLDEGVAGVDRAEDGAPAPEDAGDVPGGQHAHPVEFEQPVEAVFDPDDFEAGVAAGLDDGADDRVQAGGIAPAGEDADFLDRCGHERTNGCTESQT